MIFTINFSIILSLPASALLTPSLLEYDFSYILDIDPLIRCRVYKDTLFKILLLGELDLCFKVQPSPEVPALSLGRF